MDKHRTNVFIALVLVLLIVAAVLAWTTGSSIVNGAPSESAEPNASVNPQNGSTSSDKGKAEERVIDESGSINSETGANLNMRIDWQVSSASSKELSLNVQLYISSYAIETGPHSGAVRICGKDYTFISDSISSSDSGQMLDTLIYETTVTIPADVGETVAVPISASWNFEDSYGGRQIDRISAEQTLTIQG